MEWSNKELVESLIQRGYLKTPRIIEAFRAVDRKDFMLSEHRDEAYVDEAFPIGYGQTISQPLTVAFMLELLMPEPGDKILDVGSGSGWTTALLAYIVGKDISEKQGKVIGIERISELVEFGRENLAKYHFMHAEIRAAGDELGFSGAAPFDRILVSAASEEVPQSLIEQLTIGGRMVIPIQNSIWKIERGAGNNINKEEYFGFSFVSLVARKKTP